MKRQKKKKPKQGTGLNIQAISNSRIGYTRLVHVKQFRESYLQFLSEFSNEENELKGIPIPDISVDEVKVETPFQVVERCINEEVARISGADDSTQKRKNPPGEGEEKTSGPLQDSDVKSGGADTTEGVEDDPKFGITIPDMEALTSALAPLKQRKKKGTKKEQPANSVESRKGSNCVTKKTFEYDIKTRTEGHDPAPLREHEVLLRVAFFHPTNYSKTQEFVVYGSQSLTALKDRVYCLSNKILDGPQTPSSFFFIENKFYDDLRDPRAIRYSDTIINWVRNENRYTQPGLAHFEKASMHDTTFSDLSIRLGAHYLFCHQGDCEHVFIFTDMRIKHDQDPDNIWAYPTRPFQCKMKRRKCGVCDLYPAAFVTYGDKLASENPFFYCEECYRPLHYSYEGNLLYSDFQVYSYDHE